MNNEKCKFETFYAEKCKKKIVWKCKKALKHATTPRIGLHVLNKQYGSSITQ